MHQHFQKKSSFLTIYNKKGESHLKKIVVCQQDTL